MFKTLRDFFVFNQANRDGWVARQASLIPAGAHVLDVGAGSGPYKHWFSRCVYKAHDFEKLKPGQLREKSSYIQCDYVSDICSIPVDDGSFDVILCTEVLEHVPEPIVAVKEMARILKRGGKLILTAPLGSGLHQEPFHFYGGYTPHWYRRFLTEAGFGEIRIDPNRGFFSHYGQESLRFAQMMAPWKGGGRIVWLPIWCVSILWGLMASGMARVWDRMDKEKGYTIGYHVTAIRS